MTIRKYLFQSFLALCCTLVGCLSAHDVPVPETERETTLTLRLSPEAMTRSGDGTVQESAVHDLSLYFFHKTTPEASERLYLKNPGGRVSLSLPTGDYELFALANTGGDPGELTAERPGGAAGEPPARLYAAATQRRGARPRGYRHVRPAKRPRGRSHRDTPAAGAMPRTARSERLARRGVPAGSRTAFHCAAQRSGHPHALRRQPACHGNTAFGLRPAGNHGQQRARPHVLPAREPARHEPGRHRTPAAGHGPCPRGSDVRPYPCELHGCSAELLHFSGQQYDGRFQPAA